MKKCPRCGGELWTAFVFSYFGPAGELLYAYAKLLITDHRYTQMDAPNVWGCDACKYAAPLSYGVVRTELDLDHSRAN